VTGVPGFIGTHLCEELLDRGFQITVLDNFSTRSKVPPFFFSKRKKHPAVSRIHHGYGTDETLIERCDIVYHLAAGGGGGVHFIAMPSIPF